MNLTQLSSVTMAPETAKAPGQSPHTGSDAQLFGNLFEAQKLTVGATDPELRGHTPPEDTTGNAGAADEHGHLGVTAENVVPAAVKPLPVSTIQDVTDPVHTDISDEPDPDGQVYSIHAKPDAEVGKSGSGDKTHPSGHVTQTEPHHRLPTTQEPASIISKPVKIADQSVDRTPKARAVIELPATAIARSDLPAAPQAIPIGAVAAAPLQIPDTTQPVARAAPTNRDAIPMAVRVIAGTSSKKDVPQLVAAQASSPTPNTSEHSRMAHGNGPSLSLLDRHLGGHAVTLVDMPNAKAPASKSPAEILHFDSTAKNTGARIAPTPTTSAPALVHMVGPHAVPRPVAGPLIAPVQRWTPELPREVQTDLVSDFPLDPRASVSAPQSSGATTAPRADVAGSVVQQVTNAIKHAPDKPIEIALNPVELGRVRMFLTATDAGITVNILADRPDTLDLMRRNIDDLGRSFGEMGYEDISFSFGQNDRKPEDPFTVLNEPHPETPEGSTSGDTPAMAPQLTSALAITPGGIDMRL